MCVIVYTPKDVSIDRQVLLNCFTSNKDGAGFMYQDYNAVIIKKGYMDFESFYNDYCQVPDHIDRVAHFRIATSGKIEGGCCHPFPICDDYDQMRLTKNRVKYALAHNGVIHQCTPKKGLQEKYSDTMCFIKECLINMEEKLFEAQMKRLINLAASSSKFAIMSPNKVMLIGDFNQYEGSFFSNYSYIERKTNFTKACTTYTTYGSGNRAGTYYNDFDYDSYVYTNRIFFKMSKPDHKTAKIIMEELEKQECYVQDYDLYKSGISFNTYGFPQTTKIAGHNWTTYGTYTRNKGK